MAVVTMRQMLEAGVHFGHQTRKWNPKMRRFIFGERNGIYIIDLEQTLTRVETAYNFVRELSAKGGSVMFIGTKKQAQDPVRSYADKTGMPYVNERWLGGMLTNFETIAKRVAKMQEYERMRQSGEFDAMPKKEALLLTRELEKLQKNLGGIRGMNKRPDAVFILDTKKEHIAVTEANKLGIPIIAVVDTNVDPDVIQYPIPGNDDAIRANALMARVIAEAIEEGRYVAGKRNPQAAPKQRSAEDEAAFAATQADARRQAAAAQAERDSRLAGGPTTEPAMDESTLDESSSTGVDEALDAPVGTPAETLAEATTTDPIELAADATETTETDTTDTAAEADTDTES
jgi:small subunit ribosomal protein S2